MGKTIKSDRQQISYERTNRKTNTNKKRKENTSREELKNLKEISDAKRINLNLSQEELKTILKTKDTFLFIGKAMKDIGKELENIFEKAKKEEKSQEKQLQQIKKQFVWWQKILAVKNKIANSKVGRGISGLWKGAKAFGKSLYASATKLQNIVGSLFVIKNLKTWGTMNDAVAQVNTQLGILNKSVEETTNNMINVAARSQIGIDKTAELLNLMREARVVSKNLTKSIEGYSYSYIGILGRFQQIYEKFPIDKVIAQTHSLKYELGFSTKAAQKLNVDLLNLFSNFANKYGATAKMLEDSLSLIKSHTTDIALSFLKINKNGSFIVDERKWSNAQKQIAKTSLALRKIGIEAEDVNNIFSAITDPDRWERNMYAFQQMGISMEQLRFGDVSKTFEMVATKLPSQIKQTLEDAGEDRLMRLRMLQIRFGSMLSKESMMTLATQKKVTEEKIKQMIKERDDREAMEKQWNKTKENLNKLLMRVGNTFGTIMANLTPAFKLIKPILIKASELFGKLAKFINNPFVKYILTAWITFKIGKGLFGAFRNAFQEGKQLFDVSKKFFKFSSGKTKSLGKVIKNIFSKGEKQLTFNFGKSTNKLGSILKGFSKVGSKFGKLGKAGSLTKVGSIGGSVVGGLAKAGSIGGSVLGGAAKVGGSLLGGLKFAGGLLSKAALPLTIATALWGGISGALNDKNIRKAFNMKKGEKINASKRISAGVVGALDALTLGLIPQKSLNSMMRGVDKFNQGVADVAKKTWGFLKKGGSFLSNLFSKKNVKKSLSFVGKTVAGAMDFFSAGLIKKEKVMALEKKIFHKTKQAYNGISKAIGDAYDKSFGSGKNEKSILKSLSKKQQAEIEKYKKLTENNKKEYLEKLKGQVTKEQYNAIKKELGLKKVQEELLKENKKMNNKMEEQVKTQKETVAVTEGVKKAIVINDKKKFSDVVTAFNSEVAKQQGQVGAIKVAFAS